MSAISISFGSTPGISAVTTIASFVSEMLSIGAQSPATISNGSQTGSTKRSKKRSISRLRLPPHGARVRIASSFPGPLGGPGHAEWGAWGLPEDNVDTSRAYE